jgi:hypothetical protein
VVPRRANRASIDDAQIACHVNHGLTGHRAKAPRWFRHSNMQRARYKGPISVPYYGTVTVSGAGTACRGSVRLKM